MKKILVLLAAASTSLVLNGCLVTESSYLKKVAEVDNLTRERTELQQKYQALTAENTALKAQAAKLEGAVAGLAKEKEKLAADNLELGKVLQGRTDTLSTSVTDLRQRIADLESQNAHLKVDIAALCQVKDEKVREGSKTYENFLEALKLEISRGMVTIAELQGKLTITMDEKLLFAAGKVEVKPEGLAVLQKVAPLLKQAKVRRVVIAGHTDTTPPAGDVAEKYPSNWELAAARAIPVTRYLQAQGIDPKILSAVSYGEVRPVADNGTEEGRAKNRRIEILLLPGE